MEETCTMCCETPRNFPTREEKAALLNEYKASLDKEIQCVKEKIKELETKNN